MKRNIKHRYKRYKLSRNGTFRAYSLVICTNPQEILPTFYGRDWIVEAECKITVLKNKIRIRYEHGIIDNFYYEEEH